LEGHLPLEMLYSDFCVQMLSKFSVDKVFMHYLEKMLSTSGALPPAPRRGSALGLHWGLWSFRPPHCRPLEKILRAPMSVSLTRGSRVTQYAVCAVDYYWRALEY